MCDVGISKGWIQLNTPVDSLPLYCQLNLIFIVLLPMAGGNGNIKKCSDEDLIFLKIEFVVGMLHNTSLPLLNHSEVLTARLNVLPDGMYRVTLASVAG